MQIPIRGFRCRFAPHARADYLVWGYTVIRRALGVITTPSTVSEVAMVFHFADTILKVL